MRILWQCETFGPAGGQLDWPPGAFHVVDLVKLVRHFNLDTEMNTEGIVMEYSLVL